MVSLHSQSFVEGVSKISFRHILHRSVIFIPMNSKECIRNFRRMLTHPLSLALMALCLSAVGCRNHDNASENPSYILQLDSLIDNYKIFEREKLARINDMKSRLSKSSTSGERYSLSSFLADEYYNYNSDSALKYINQAIGLAERSGNNEWLAHSRIKKTGYLTVTGLLGEARQQIDSVSPANLPTDLLVEYYGQMIYLLSHLGNYNGGDYNDFYIHEKLYKDSIMRIIPKDNPDYLWYKGLDLLGTDKSKDSTIKAIEKRVNDKGIDFQEKAKLYYILAKLYQNAGDFENYKKNMAVSAMFDVKASNFCELSSLEELAGIMYDNGNGDISHAYKYINYCLNKALAYPNRVKAYGISGSIGAINDAYKMRLENQKENTSRVLVWVWLLVGVLCAAVVTIVTMYFRIQKQKRNLRKNNIQLSRNVSDLENTRRKLNDMNLELKNVNQRLHNKNEELNEANYVKEKYICNIFSICSAYIEQIASLKRKIHFNVVSKKYREIEKETEDFDMKEEMKEFYRSFDTIFLNIYPDFINDFNNLLQDDQKIIPKPGELLNTELRIYALIRLGITDSIKIAEFLHCKPQTVYNNRFKVRSKAIIDKKEFAQTVRTLGQFNNQES